MSRPDPHSYADDTQPRTRSFDWKASVDFKTRILRAEVTLNLASPSEGGPLDLDTRDLMIHAVLDQEGHPLAFIHHPADPLLGRRLEISVPSGVSSIRIRYETSPDASALQWLTPEQTLGREYPYLFSQCQAIHARSVLPCQDTPSIRQTYTAIIETPGELVAVMAAASEGKEEHGTHVNYRFSMPLPIPPYLFAFAVGHMTSQDLSPRSRVWCEPEQIEAAAWEFAQVEDHVRAAEALFGPYDWERFDLLVMPPSFPYGGMENPRLTFLTPSLLAGDRSLVNVLAHELAHSWTGNLVTNANAEHFWLNEGFTVFAERRILEAIEGSEVADLHAAIGYERLQQVFSRFSKTPELTKLHTHLTGIDPDDAFSQVPYEKGYLFLKTIETAMGRSAFDQLLSSWLGAHRFGAVTTDDFLQLVEQKHPGLLKEIDAHAWVHEPGLPSSFRKSSSVRLQAVLDTTGRLPTSAEAQAWTPVEWQLYLEATVKPASLALCEQLDQQYSLTSSKNYEVLVSWLVLACESGYDAVLPRVEAVLGSIGRMKYLQPLYKALSSRAATKLLAQKLFQQYSAQYHPIAQRMVQQILSS